MLLNYLKQLRGINITKKHTPKPTNPQRNKNEEQKMAKMTKVKKISQEWKKG